MQRENRKPGNMPNWKRSVLKWRPRLGISVITLGRGSRDNSTTNQQKPKEAPAVAAVASMDTNPDYKPRIIDLLDDVDKGYQFGEYNVEAFECDAYDDMNQYKSVYE